MEAIINFAKGFWDWFTSIDDAYFTLVAAMIMLGVFLYLIYVICNAWWDRQEKKAVESINAIFDSFKKSPVAKAAMFIVALFGFGANDTNSNNNP